MKREIAMIAFVLLGMGMTASAQFGKKINLGKALQAGKDVQGHGISQKTINYIIEHLSTDIQKILLEVRKDNNNALQAYHKMGF